MPQPQPQPEDVSHLRISDDDRFTVAELLREAAGEGRIDLEELDERLGAAYAAKTYADLVPITLDLPGALPARVQGASSVSPVSPSGSSTSPSSERHIAIMSGLDRSGTWTVPAAMTVLCVMGGADLDMREATFAAAEVVVTVNAVMGGATITVGPDTRVVMEGIGIMGGFSGPSEVGDPGHPQVLRVRGFALMGGVTVQRR